jgi:hypothetical protein
MQIIVFSIALVFSTIATAADVMRCGTDQFGNVVCLDTDCGFNPSMQQVG